MHIIETPRLLLRRFTAAAYKELFEQHSMAETMQLAGFDSEEQYRAEKEKHDKGMTTYRTSFVYFYLVDKSSGKTIGDCSLHTWYFLHARAEIGYGIRKEEDKNKGYMKEAILPIIRYGFTEMNLNRIEALISPLNTPSRRLLEGMGFTQEGLLREHYCKNGILEDSLMYGLLRKEFTL